MENLVVTPQERTFPLTDIQRAYVIGRNRGLELGGVASHHYLEFEEAGLDVPGLETALNKVIARHEMLRACVTPDGSQRVSATVPPYRIATADLSLVPTAERDAGIQGVRDELCEQMLPQERWPPFDIRATLLDGGRVRLHVSMDLLLVDIRSLLLLLAEWRRFYDDPDWSPEPPGLSFGDYLALAEGDQRAEAQAAEYWKGRLESLPPAPELPLAVAPEQVDRPVFTRRHHLLTHERWARLSEAARTRGLTPAAVLLAAYTEVLRTWSKRQECTVTVSMLDRRPLDPRVDRLVGDFLAPNLLAVDSAAEQPFAERAAALHRRLRTDMAHAAFDGVRVLRELTRHRGAGRGVSMPVVFTSTLDGTPGPAWGGFGDPVHVASQTPQIWLENQVFAEDGGVSVTWNAVEELFPAGTLDTMFQAYRTLLDRLADDPGVWDRTGGVVPLPAEQLTERQRANATAADIPPRLLHDLVADAADRTPDAVAVIAGGTEVTYRRLTEDAHRLAHRLPACEPNELVAVSMRPGVAQISAILGVLHTGAAYVAIDPELPEERRHRLLRRCHAKALVTEPDLSAAWPGDVQVVTLDERESRDRPAHRPESRQTHDDLAYVIFTSGSTGTPKGVAITHRSAANTVQDINRRFAVTTRDRVLALAPTNFDLSVYDIFGVLGAGGTVVIPSPERSGDPGHWTDLVDRHGVTLWNSVPAPMRIWAESLTPETAHRGRTLRLALLSGDWIPVDLPGKVRTLLPEAELISLGGATEGSIWSVHHPIDHVPAAWTSIPYGKPLANQTLHVYNTWLEPCPAGVTGEIYIGGTGVARGYWEDPDRTAERFIVHPRTGERLYRTGDLGRYLPGGDIEILGREDFQVKINGYRVELGEIEAALARLPGVRQVLVTAPEHLGSGQRQLTAYVVAEDADPATLRAGLRDVLPSYMVPTHYLRLDALPLTPNGKIDRAALPRPWTDEGKDSGHTAPGNEVEEQLLKIWGEQLGHHEFGTDDGFFDVGGDSLHAMGIITRLRAEFDIDTGTEQEVVEGLFLNATIASFAEIIAKPTP